jgi:hypothetical protein
VRRILDVVLADLVAINRVQLDFAVTASRDHLVLAQGVTRLQRLVLTMILIQEERLNKHDSSSINKKSVRYQLDDQHVKSVR